MIDFNVSVSAPPHEYQIVTWLPAGGGDKGGLGGSSVAVTCGVPMTVGGAWGGVVAPICVLTGVTDLDGVRVGLGVVVAGPGYGWGAFVIIALGDDGEVSVLMGPGYGTGVSMSTGARESWASVEETSGPGYCGVTGIVAVGVGGLRVWV